MNFKQTYKRHHRRRKVKKHVGWGSPKHIKVKRLNQVKIDMKNENIADGII